MKWGDDSAGGVQGGPVQLKEGVEKPQYREDQSGVTHGTDQSGANLWDLGHEKGYFLGWKDATAQAEGVFRTEGRRFQLARDLLVAQIGKTGFYREGHAAEDAVDLADQLIAALAKPVGTKAAMDALQQALQSDQDYAWGWHCNIAMCAVDAGASSEVGNEAASRFMKLCFGVTTKEPVHQPAPEGGE